jgi:hypothetical protein
LLPYKEVQKDLQQKVRQPSVMGYYLTTLSVLNQSTTQAWRPECMDEPVVALDVQSQQPYSAKVT